MFERESDEIYVGMWLIVLVMYLHEIGPSTILQPPAHNLHGKVSEN